MSDESKVPEFDDPELGEVSAEELAEAGQLALSLSGKAADLSEATAEGVGVLRMARHAELSPNALARIEAEVLEGYRPAEVEPPLPVGIRRVWWWVLAGFAPAAAALVMVLFKTSVPEGGLSAELPPPDVDVLQAQASWVVSDAERPAFEREMRDYRAQVLASLDLR